MKNAIITGASTGIGKTTSLIFAQAGYKVFLVARSEDKLEELANKIHSKGGEAEVVVTDLSKVESVNDLIESIKMIVDEVHAVINIAGIWHGPCNVYADTNFADFSQEVILDTYNVGFTAPTLLVHGLLPLMQGSSKIVNLSGTFEGGAKGWLPYYASKRAIEDLTIGLSQELQERGIHVNCVSPSDTATESYAKHFPQYMDEAIEPEKIGKKILELCDETNEVSGKVIVMKKDTEPFEGFHS